MSSWESSWEQAALKLGEACDADGADASPLVSTRGVSRVYRLRGETVYAVRDVNVDIYQGEYVSIMGQSGSGKTTLFNMIGALDTPSSGSVKVGPMDLTKLSHRQLAYVRCHYIGYIFQAYNLVPALSALQNVALPRIFTGATTAKAEDAAKVALARVGLGHRLNHRPDELSGGQQQRVAIARALVNDPAIILADEPTANLDFRTGDAIIALLKELSAAHGVTIITATHDHKMLANSDRVIWMADGQIRKISRRDELQIQQASMH